jgi:hypothetical protein
MYAGVIGLAIAASGTSLGNGFALDDLALVAGNSRVHSLDQWWRLFALPYWPPQYGASLYRPVVTLGYALQWIAGNGSPWVFHLASVALYVGVCVAVLALLLEITSPMGAVVGAALFAVHPVHVEAVANVVGQCELIAAVASLTACVIYVRARRVGPVGPAAFCSIAVLFAIACLSKEHALLLPALLIALEAFAVRVADDGARSVGARARAVVAVYVTLAAVGLGYLAVRTAVVGELLGEKHLVPVNGLRRVWAMLAVAPHWVRLLAWPAHLSADYSPQQIVVPEGPGAAIIAGLAVVAMAAAAFVALGTGGDATKGDRAAARLGLAWLAITLLPVSNLFSVMLVAERTLLMPSVGAVLIGGVAFAVAWRRLAAISRVREARAVLGVAATTIVALAVFRSATRQAVWRDNETLFAQTVIDAPRSYRAQFFYGQMLFQQGKRAEGERRLRQAIALNPTPSDVSPLNYLATEYRDAGLCRQALPLYERALANDAARPDVRYGMAACLLAVGRVDEARRLAQDGVRRGDLKSLFLDLLARSDSASRGG